MHTGKSKMTSDLALCFIVIDGSSTMLLRAGYTRPSACWSVLSQIHNHLIRSMADQPISEERTAPETSSGINSLIAAANKDDRFKLLEDNGVQAANLNIPIHAVFSWFDCDGPMKQMLQLASQFLAHDSVLVFFVPLLYGRLLTRKDKNTSKSYLSDPLVHCSDARRKELIAGVRQALHCLAHSVELRFMKPEKRVYARTLTKLSRPVHTPACSPVFQRRSIAVIEISDRFSRFYYTDDGYKFSSRCAQFRHDFLFASTLVHEIIHAIGVTRRGNLIEPYIRVNDPDPEWGYAWEQFIFGCVINPQDRTKPGTHLLMRKVWTDPTVADKIGGKEYSDVSMAYIAQWFRQETWDTIAKQGPTAIPPPEAHFKIQSSRKYGGWVVSTDCIDIKPDLVALHRGWKRQCEKFDANGHPATASFRIFWHFQTTTALQMSNVPTPPRVPWLSYDRESCVKSVPPSRKLCLPVCKATRESIEVQQTTSMRTGDLLSRTHKRKAVEETEVLRVSKIEKR